MEGLYINNNNAKTPRIKSLSGNVSPINTQMVMEASDSTFLMRRFLRSGSPSPGSNSSGSSRGSLPLSAVENVRSPTGFRTPVKMEDEDVVIIDGILIGSSPSGSSFYKTEICRSWEGSGKCRHGSKCQFAHGKEELRSTRSHLKNKSEAQLSKSFTATGLCTYSPKRSFVNQGMAGATTEAAKAPVQTISPLKLEYTSKSPGTPIATRDWSPQDDGIEVALPSTDKVPSMAEVDAHIQAVLYGPTTSRRRLPVFEEICPL